MKMQIVFGGRCAGKSILKRLIADQPEYDENYKVIK